MRRHSPITKTNCRGFFAITFSGSPVALSKSLVTVVYCPMRRVLPIVVCAFAFLAKGATGSAVDFPDPTGSTFAHTFPYSMIGQLLFDSGRGSYSGTGTVIRAQSVITAGHNLYDVYNGWSTRIVFRRGQYGETTLNEKYPSRLLVLAGYQTRVAYNGPESIRTFAVDTGAMKFTQPVAGGASVGWTTDISLLRGDSYRIALGYGAETHSGDDLLFVEPNRAFYQTVGAFYENESIYFEPGMSGGPVFARDGDGNLFVCATIVSGSDDPVAGGVRIFNAKVADLINNHLR
jgi:hypothetical protein